jgi:hypothetical protein
MEPPDSPLNNNAPQKIQIQEPRDLGWANHFWDGYKYRQERWWRTFYRPYGFSASWGSRLGFHGLQATIQYSRDALLVSCMDCHCWFSSHCPRFSLRFNIKRPGWRSTNLKSLGVITLYRRRPNGQRSDDGRHSCT